MTKINIALMAGGNSSEYEISLQSAAQVAKVIDAQKYNTYRVLVKGNRWLCESPGQAEAEVDKNDFSVTIAGEKIRFDYALILIHGTPGEDGLLQAYFELTGVSYSSCGFVASAVTFDKSLCKRVLARTTVRTAGEVLIEKSEPVDPANIVWKLGLPLFVKPNASGSSYGITKVKTEAGLLSAIEKARAESDQVLIEEFIEGCEVSCGIMIAGGRTYFFPATEIVPKTEFFDREAKYTAGMSEEITPARLSPEIVEKLNSNSETIYRTLGCRGIVRIDYIIRSGEPHMIEVNTVPGMTENSLIPKQCAAMGISLGELFDIIIGETYSPRKF